MTKLFSYIIVLLAVLVVVLGIALAIFVGPLFQADEMLAQIRVMEVVNKNCYLISLELMPENDAQQRQIILDREPICGDFLGLGYEFALPEKMFAIMKKPGILITNVVAFDQKTRDQTGNIRIGSYEIEFVDSIRAYVAYLLKKTPAFKSITYDIKVPMQQPQKGAVISYKLEPLRQQVIVECQGCKE